MNKLIALITFLFFTTVAYSQNSDEAADGDAEPKTEMVEKKVADGPAKTLPSVTVKNIEGKEVNLQDYGSNGKITVISFWATWCKPCIKELKNMNDLLDEWVEDYGMELVAISVDDSRNTSKVRPVVNGLGWDFDVLLDPNGDIQRALNVANPPVTFLIDQKGNIVYTHTGYVEGDEYELEEHIKELVE